MLLSVTAEGEGLENGIFVNQDSLLVRKGDLLPYAENNLL